MTLSPADIREIHALVDSRLKHSRHEASDHLDRGLLAQKITPGSAALTVLSNNGTDVSWDSPKGLGLATLGDLDWKSDTDHNHYGTHLGLVKVGSFTASAGTGVKAVTGVGFRPRLVQFYNLTGSNTTIGTWGHGWMDDQGNQFVVIGASDANGGSQNNSTSACHGVPTSASSAAFYNSAAFSSMDADGFSVDFTIHTAPIAAGYVAFG